MVRVALESAEACHALAAAMAELSAGFS